MFFLRCVFWLSLVYASMSWNDHRFSGAELRTRAVAAANEDAPVLARRLASQTSSVCANRVVTCAEDAVRLAALFASVQSPRQEFSHSTARARDGVTKRDLGGMP